VKDTHDFQKHAPSCTPTVSGATIDLQVSFTHGGPVNGASLEFQVDGASVGQCVTGPDGNTTVACKLPDSFSPGEHTIHVNFKGDVKMLFWTIWRAIV
jgi:hypothetical protein